MAKEDKDKNSTISIKLNGKERPFEEKTIFHDWQAASEETSAASSDDALEEEFDWVLPNQEEQKEIPEFKIQSNSEPDKRPYINRANKGPIQSSIKRLILSFVLAISVGLLLGTLLIEVMKREDARPTTAAQQPAVQTEGQPDTQKEAEKTAGYKATLPGFTIPVLQAGLYSTKESAESTAAGLAEKNHAHTIIEMEGKYYIFLGVSDDIQAAKTWEKRLKENGLSDVWAKELSFEEKTIQLDSKEQSEQILKEANFIKKLAGETTKMQLGEKASSEVIQDGVQLIEAGKTMAYKNEEIVNLHKKLETAVKGLQENQSAVKVQQQLLDYLSSYYQISS